MKQRPAYDWEPPPTKPAPAPWMESDEDSPQSWRVVEDAPVPDSIDSDSKTGLDRLARTGKVRDADLDDVIGLASRAQEE